MESNFGLTQRITPIPVLVVLLGLSYVPIYMNYVATLQHRYQLHMHLSDHFVKCVFVLHWNLLQLPHVEENYDGV